MAGLSLKDTMNRLMLLIRAGYPVIYVVSHEETRVLDYLTRIFRLVKHERPHKKLLRWYQGVGLEELTNIEPHDLAGHEPVWLDIEGLPQVPVWNGHGAQSPLDALNAVRDAEFGGNPLLGDSLTVFFDLHPFLVSDTKAGITGALVRPLRNLADKLRRDYDRDAGQPAQQDRHYKTVVVVAPSYTNVSPELERDVIRLDFPLPETDELRLTLAGYLPAPDAEELTGRRGLGTHILGFKQGTSREEKKRLSELVAGAGRGLTLEDYKRGLNMFAVRGDELQERHIEDMLDLKAKTITNEALQYTPHVDIELGGLEGIKDWVRIRKEAAVSESVREEFHLPAPKGVMLCGASGGGKSELAKLIAKEFNLALLRLDVGALFGMYVGESEERTRTALRLAEVLAPVVLWLDEVDKAFTGVAAAGDSGASARVFGHFLTWLAEKKDTVFVVATANDFEDMLTKFPEFGRKGRFDEIFWVGLPDRDSRRAIFEIYLRPHAKDGYFMVTDEEVRELAREKRVPVSESGNAIQKFCGMLSHQTISNNLTGAEIRYAVETALYNAHHNYQEGKQDRGLSARLVLETVANQKALYDPNGNDGKKLAKLQADADIKGWPYAGKV